MLLAAAFGESGEGEKGEGEKGEGERGEGEKGEGESGEGESGEGEAGESGHSVDAMPLAHRLAFMTGHVKAGLALYRAGEAEAAAPHLKHPVSETHKAERKGLKKLGFEKKAFLKVSKALKAGKPASDVEPLLAAAEANLAAVSEEAGGDDYDVIRFLMSAIVEEYSIAVTDGVISDANEYQDAYGFAVVARERAEKLDVPNPDIIAALDDLIGLWSDGPVPVDEPAPVGQVVAQTSRVELEMPATN